MELIINEIAVQPIQWKNHEQLKQELALQLEKYQGLTYTENEIKTAKADRATLNKFKEAIENKRKEIKKQCMQPYEEFEVKCKEIVALVDKPILEIDTQVKGFEDKVKEQKIADIDTLYRENIEADGLGDILPLKTLWNDRWTNVTYKLTDIFRELFETKQKVKQDLEVIENLNSEFDLQAKDMYLRTLDLSKALQEKTRLEEQKAKLQEFKKQEEAKKADLCEKTYQTENNPAEVIQSVEVAKELIIESQETELEEIFFRVLVTPQQKILLRQFFQTTRIIVKKA